MTTNWGVIQSTSEYDPFLVDDGTGTAYVDPSNAKVILERDDTIPVDKHEEPPEAVREYLEALDRNVLPVTKYDRRYAESRLDVDGEVRVVGRADPDDVPDAVGSATTAIAAAGDAADFYVTDDPDFDLETQLRHQAAGYFFLAVVMFVVSYLLLFA